MKIQSKFPALVSIAALVVGPLVFADDAVPITPEVADCPVIVDVPKDVEITTDSGAADSGKDVSGEVADPCEPAPDDVVTLDDGPVKDGGEVPIDWVKRGGGDNPDVIFYNMAGGPSPEVVAKGETSTTLSRELGHDEKGAAIEAKGNAVVPQVKGEKKEPVAVIKKGHVFLR